MRAQIIRSFGGPDVFEPADVPDPSPEAGEVLVRLSATSINPVDVKLRRNGPSSAPDLPAILGCDVAGTVVSVGPRTVGFVPGDRVFGCAGGVRGLGGTYAELIAADASLLAHAPSSISLRDAAALPLVAITAWEGLERSQVQEGSQILVHGGAGGVGHMAIQLAKSRGAFVATTVSSAAKARIALELGADEVILYREEAVSSYVQRLTRGRGFDVVFDTTGGADLARSFEAARINGHVAVIVASYTADLLPMHAKGLSLHAVLMLLPLLHGFGREAHGEIMRQIAQLVDAGKIKPLIDPDHFGLADVAKAHAKLEAGQAVGKLLVDI